jgi:hypothetical protein
MGPKLVWVVPMFGDYLQRTLFWTEQLQRGFSIRNIFIDIDVKAFKVRYLTMLSVAKKVKRLCQEKWIIGGNILTGGQGSTREKKSGTVPLSEPQIPQD